MKTKILSLVAGFAFFLAGNRPVHAGLDYSSDLLHAVLTSGADSIVEICSGNSWDPKNVYVKNSDNQAAITNYYQSDGQWQLEMKGEFLMNSQGKIVRETIQGFDSSTGDFVPWQKREYEYDEYGNEIAYKEYSWDSNSDEWILGDYNTAAEYEYDTQGNILTKITNGTLKDVYEYDAQGNNISILEYRLQNGEWEITIPKYEYAYDAQGRKITEICYESVSTTNGNSTFSLGNYGYKAEWTYDAQGNILSQKKYSDLESRNIKASESYNYDEGKLVSRTDSAQYSFSISAIKIGGVIVTFNPPRSLSTYELSAENARIYDAENRIKTTIRTEYDYEPISLDAAGIKSRNTTNITTYYYANGTGIRPPKEPDNIYVSGSTLYINTPTQETVSIYSLTGALLYTTTEKQIPLDGINEKILIVRGSEGWAKKVINK
jgi:YD repeat-containing protein